MLEDSLFQKQVLNRRQALRLIVPAVVASTSVFRSIDSLAQTLNGKYDVSYLWHPDIEAVRDYMEDVAGAIGEDSAEKLMIVRGRQNFGLIENLDEDRVSAVRTASRRTEDLLKADLDPASIANDSDHYELYNISFGTGPNLDFLKRLYADRIRVLGPDVGKELFIERNERGRFALVYKRLGDYETTNMRAQQIAKRFGIPATSIREVNNEIIYGGSRKSAEDIKGKPDSTVKPRIPKPESPPIRPPTSNLERVVESQIDRERKRENLAENEITAWVIYDHATGDKLVSINEDAPMQQASMVKPFVALGIMHLAGEKRIRYDGRTKRTMERMIQRSNNSATNSLIRKAGGPRRLNALLHSEYGSILPQTRIVEEIPGSGATYANTSSAHDYSRFLYALWNNQFPGSAEIRRLMALENRDRIFDGVPNIPYGTGVYDKTGSTARLCGDMGILVARGKDGKRYPYTIVGIIEKGRRAPNYSAWIASRGNVIRRISSTVYEHMQQRHNLI